MEECVHVLVVVCVNVTYTIQRHGSSNIVFNVLLKRDALFQSGPLWGLFIEAFVWQASSSLLRYKRMCGVGRIK